MDPGKKTGCALDVLSCRIFKLNFKKPVRKNSSLPTGVRNARCCLYCRLTRDAATGPADHFLIWVSMSDDSSVDSELAALLDEELFAEGEPAAAEGSQPARGAAAPEEQQQSKRPRWSGRTPEPIELDDEDKEFLESIGVDQEGSDSDGQQQKEQKKECEQHPGYWQGMCIVCGVRRPAADPTQPGSEAAEPLTKIRHLHHKAALEVGAPAQSVCSVESTVLPAGADCPTCWLVAAAGSCWSCPTHTQLRQLLRQQTLRRNKQAQHIRRGAVIPHPVAHPAAAASHCVCVCAAPHVSCTHIHTLLSLCPLSHTVCCPLSHTVCIRSPRTRLPASPTRAGGA